MSSQIKSLTVNNRVFENLEYIYTGDNAKQMARLTVINVYSSREIRC